MVTFYVIIQGNGNLFSWEFTHFPSTTLKFESHIGKQPQATTRSVGVTAPRRRNNSNTRTIPGRMSGRAGHTVKTL